MVRCGELRGWDFFRVSDIRNEGDDLLTVSLIRVLVIDGPHVKSRQVGYLRQSVTKPVRFLAIVDASAPLSANGSRDATARVWDVATGRCLHTGHVGPAWDVAFSRDSRLLATASSDQTPSTGSGVNLILSVTEV